MVSNVFTINAKRKSQLDERNAGNDKCHKYEDDHRGFGQNPTAYG